MSMRSSFVYGYGFNCDCDENKLIDFIKNHSETFVKSDEERELYEDILNYTENEYDLEDFFDDYECDSNGLQGTGAVIANIMSRETGIKFDYCVPDEDCGTFASIIFETGYPWSESEKNLTKEKLSEICIKYMSELGLTEEPDYLELEYFG